MYGIKGLARCLSVILLFALSIYSPAAYPQQFIAKNGEIRGTVYGGQAPRLNRRSTGKRHGSVGRNWAKYPDR